MQSARDSVAPPLVLSLQNEHLVFVAWIASGCVTSCERTPTGVNKVHPGWVSYVDTVWGHSVCA